MRGKTTMYYLIEKRYVGPNAQEEPYVDADRVWISTIPARTNAGGNICIDGWCGTTNDWSIYAHGEYDSIEAARAELASEFGPVREADPAGDPEIVESYKLGEYKPLGRDATREWALELLKGDITANADDGELEALVEHYQLLANGEGLELDTIALSALARELRYELREDA